MTVNLDDVGKWPFQKCLDKKRAAAFCTDIIRVNHLYNYSTFEQKSSKVYRVQNPQVQLEDAIGSSRM